MSRRPNQDLPTAPFLTTADGHGSLSRASTRSLSLMRPSRGLRIPRELPPDMLTRARAVALANRDDAVLWGPTAAMLLGLPIPRRLQDAAVHVLVPEGRPRPRRQGVRPRQADIVPGEIAVVADLSVTSPARTYCDLAAALSVPSLVALGDAVLRDHHTDQDLIARTIRRRLRYPGKVRARQTLPMLDPRSASPQESRLRAHVLLEGLPTPEVNGIIVDEAGQFLACCDLVFREQRVVAEYDGEVHDLPEARRRGATRRTLLRAHGWQVVEIVDTDLIHPERAMSKLRRALSQPPRWAPPR